MAEDGNQERRYPLRPHFERYQQCMNSSLSDKLDKIMPGLEKYFRAEKPVILSIGAGTGCLETEISKIFRNCTMIALDYSMPMLETIPGNSNPGRTGEPHREVERILADAGNLPFRPNSLDAVIASSVLHEIATFKDNSKFGETVEGFFMQVAERLKPGGRLIIRDFMQPNDPNKIIKVRVGEAKPGDPMDPLDFIEKFAETFKGDDLDYVRRQIGRLKEQGKWKHGVTIDIRMSHAFEALTHYSWSQSFDDEVKEKYAYLPLSEYVKFIVSASKKVGVTLEVVQQYTYLQDGYERHTLGRLDFFDQKGKLLRFPDITGVVILEKPK